MTPTKEQLADPNWWDENAPEGATHYMNGSRCPFRKLDGASWYALSNSVWYPVECPTPDDYMRRPLLSEQWAGPEGGLPPVGTVCEVYHCDEWLPGKVIAHFQQRAGMVAAYTVEVGSVGSGIKHLDSAIGECFRLIRTPEMIEAEEREKAIQQMIEDAVSVGQRIREIFSKLYDAGYRKQEQPK